MLRLQKKQAVEVNVDDDEEEEEDVKEDKISIRDNEITQQLQLCLLIIATYFCLFSLCCVYARVLLTNMHSKRKRERERAKKAQCASIVGSLFVRSMSFFPNFVITIETEFFDKTHFLPSLPHPSFTFFFFFFSFFAAVNFAVFFFFFFILVTYFPNLIKFFINAHKHTHNQTRKQKVNCIKNERTKKLI